MKIFVDVDETICDYDGERDYAIAQPIVKNIEKVNQLYDQGHTIVYWTARGSMTGIDQYPLTKSQLDAWGAKHHGLMLGKPSFDLLIDDKALNSIDHWPDNSAVLQRLNRPKNGLVKLCAIIPARYAASRLPGKLMLEIGGKSIIRRTYEQTCQSKYLDQIYIATDDDRLVEHASQFCDSVIKVTEECLNGTERICRILPQLSDEYTAIVNVQGDEPFIDPAHIDYTIEKYLEDQKQPDHVCTTIHFPLTETTDITGRTVGKMVFDRHQNVMYCSRAMIPHTKSGLPTPAGGYQGHIGIFVFRRSYLETEYMKENTPCQLAEDIEWLKIIEQGYRIKSYAVTQSEIGINTSDDYNYLSQKYSGL